MKIFRAIQRFFKSKFYAYGLFWSWNFLFAILFFWIEAETSFTFNIVRDVFQGSMPYDLALFGILALFLPLVSIILGLTKFKNKQQKLIHLFYGVEAPLLMFCLLRITILRELTAGTSHLLFLAVIGGLFYFYGLINEEESSDKKWQNLNYIANIFMLLVGLFVAAIISFYVFPILCEFFGSIGSIFRNVSLNELFTLGFFGTLFLLFFFYTASLFIFTPIALPFIYGKSFQNSFHKYKLLFGKRSAILILVVTIALNVLIFGTLNWNQPQLKAFDLLSEPAVTAIEQKALLEEEDLIREGLLNAYLAKYRYISGVENNNHIEELYKQSIGVSDNVANAFQDVYNVLLKAFLYDGDMMKDRMKSMKEYEVFFDRPIDKFEKERITSAIQATWDRDGIEASLLNINEEKVLIKSQSVSIENNAQFATIELYEIYQNQTFNREEIFYYFSLPETAVVTGLWLSDDDLNKKKFPFRVSPRGAAQEVYKKEVQRRVDPSLLEQVGPRQYRLRAFPILPKSKVYTQLNRGDVVDGPNFHLWFQYKVPLTSNEVYLPTLLERRNVYWDDSTVFTVNDIKTDRNEGDWYPKVCQLQQDYSFKENIAKLQDSIFIKTSKYDLPFKALNLKSIAVVVDQSYSMRGSKQDVKTTLKQLKESFKSATIDVITAQGEVKKRRLNEFQNDIENNGVDGFNCFGNKAYLAVLHEISPVIEKSEYDFILVISDQGSYELMVDSLPAFSSEPPIYLLHLGGKLPAVYSDAEIETIEKSRGKSILGVEEISNHQSFLSLRKDNPTYINFADGLLFEEVQRDSADHNSDFSAIAARQYLLKKAKKLDLSNRLTTMDEIHSIAQSIGFVSPYSSMIVLVNERQHQALNEAEASEDRFDREVENGAANLSLPNNPFQVSGTPEPEEWMLMGVIGCFLVLSLLKGRFF